MSIFILKFEVPIYIHNEIVNLKAIINWKI